MCVRRVPTGLVNLARCRGWQRDAEALDPAREDSDVREVQRVLKEFRERRPCVTHHPWILGRLTHTQQTLRVSREEWEAVVLIREGE